MLCREIGKTAVRPWNIVPPGGLPEFHERSPYEEEKDNTKKKPAGKADDPGNAELQPGNGNRNKRDGRDKRIRNQGDYQDNEDCRLQFLLLHTSSFSLISNSLTTLMPRSNFWKEKAGNRWPVNPENSRL
jgi:hypothetical protein